MKRPVIALVVLLLLAALSVGAVTWQRGAAPAWVARLGATLGIGGGDHRWYSGYVEADYLFVASTLGGTLQRLAVQRGDRVAAGDALFALDPQPERTARDEAAARLAQAEASLRNLETGRRPEEIDAIRAQRAQAAAALRQSEADFTRQSNLRRTGTASQSQYDTARARRDADRARVKELDAQLAVARLPARAAEIRAAAAAVTAARAALATADWKLAQKSVAAPAAGVVVDTLYRAGEPVPANAPVVQLLPPANIKVRFFVPEGAVARLAVGQTVRLACDGCADPPAAVISYIAPSAEFTPPVIYSRAQRARLVFMVEARPVARAETLRPGQPVEVTPLFGAAPGTTAIRGGAP